MIKLKTIYYTYYKDMIFLDLHDFYKYYSNLTPQVFKRIFEMYDDKNHSFK
jgi:hypothetical protein